MLGFKRSKLHIAGREMYSCVKRSIWTGIDVLTQSHEQNSPKESLPDHTLQEFSPLPLAFNNLISDLDSAAAESWLTKFMDVLDLEEPLETQEMNLKLSCQSEKRLHSQEAEIS